MDPSKLLIGLDKLFDLSGIKKYPHPGDILLTRRVRNISEDRRCAIFCHAMGQVLGKKILFASCENSDYDYVGAYAHRGSTYKFPIQLKQLVPDRLNPTTSLKDEICKLKKYVNGQDLVVAIHINRKVNFRPHSLEVSRLNIKEIWLYGRHRDNSWILYGNLMREDANAYRFQLPVV